MFSAFQRAAAFAQQAGHICYLAPHVGDSLVCRARQTSLANFLESDCDYYFTLDDDIALPDLAFQKLVDANKDFIGGLYRLKFRYNPGTDVKDTIATRLVPNKIINIGQEHVQEVQYLSTGCVMHTRQFIEDMWEKYYDERWYYENQTLRKMVALYTPLIHPTDREYLSEDWAFCYRAQQIGYKAYAHGNVLCDHWGLEKYSFNDIFADYGEEAVDGNDTSE
jgi:hypothetical protein